MSDPDFDNALTIALKAIAKHEKFVAEIRSLLERKGVDEEAANRVVAHLTSKGILNDKRCAELALTRLNAKGDLGRQRLCAALESRGAPSELIETLVPPDPEHHRLHEILTKRFPNGAKPDKAARYLISRGYNEEDSVSAADAFAQEDPAQ